MSIRRALVCGGGGFIGSHLVRRLKQEGYWVRGVDLKNPEFSSTAADDFVVADLRERESWQEILDVPFDEAYQLAADMGGAGYIFTGDNDSHVMHNSAMINLHMADFGVKNKVRKIFYSSSACMYPAHNQEDPRNPKCAESTAYPAAPDSEYGGEKLFSERLYLACSRNHGLDHGNRPKKVDDQARIRPHGRPWPQFRQGTHTHGARPGAEHAPATS